MAESLIGPDGLPIVPLTDDRLWEALQYAGRAPTDEIGAVPPGLGMATVEAIARCAVMAGCPPLTLPFVIAAVGAMLEEKFNLFGLETTTGNAAVGVIINGPQAQELGFNCGGNAMGPGAWANAAVGRAVRLVLLTIGGSEPGVMDMASLGWPGKFTFCFAENEEESPWTPLHVERGFSREETTVTVVGAAGVVEVANAVSGAPEGVLTLMANSMTIAGTAAGARVLGGGEPLVVLTPEDAQIVARGGFSKADAREFIWENARLPLSRLGTEKADHIWNARRDLGLEPESDLLVAVRSENVMIVVAGGVGRKSAYVPTWNGGTRSVTRAVSLRPA